MSVRFAYPGDYVDRSEIPGLVDAPCAETAPPDVLKDFWALQFNPQDAAIPLSEEGVIAMGRRRQRMVDRWYQHKRLRDWTIPQPHALEVRSERDLAAVLPVLERNWPAVWVKRRVSTLGQGVVHAGTAETALALLDNDAAGMAAQKRYHALSDVQLFGWLVQEHAEGAIYDANVAYVGTKVYPGPVMREVWVTEEHRPGRISQYMPANARITHELTLVMSGLAEACAGSVAWSGFLNAEIALTRHGPRVLEIHMRPGDDCPSKGYQVPDWLPHACRWVAAQG